MPPAKLLVPGCYALLFFIAHLFDSQSCEPTLHDKDAFHWSCLVRAWQLQHLSLHSGLLKCAFPMKHACWCLPASRCIVPARGNIDTSSSLRLSIFCCSNALAETQAGSCQAQTLQFVLFGQLLGPRDSFNPKLQSPHASHHPDFDTEQSSDRCTLKYTLLFLV